MAYTTINKSTDYFNTKLYTGNGSTNAVTGVGFAPDFVWIKERTSTSSHVLGTTVQGTTKRLQSDTTSAEGTLTNIFTSYDSDGFTHGNDAGVNESGQTYASWNWKANGAGSTNYDGSITSTVSANIVSGMSIVSYTGSTGNYQVGHGLGSAPKMVIVKSRDNARNWVVYHQGIGAGNWLYLNQNYPQSADVNYWNNTNPTNSVFSVSNTNYNENNGNGENYIAYCFAEKTGYSKFGSYTGNGQSGNSAPFIYTGFKPAFVLLKNADGTYNWNMQDNKRDTFNPVDKHIAPNGNSAEATSSSYNVDFLSNGFQLRNSLAVWNGSGNTHIYMAFAEAPLVGSNNVPCTAR